MYYNYGPCRPARFTCTIIIDRVGMHDLHVSTIIIERVGLHDLHVHGGTIIISPFRGSAEGAVGADRTRRSTCTISINCVDMHDLHVL